MESKRSLGVRHARDWYVFHYCMRHLTKVIKRIYPLNKFAVQFYYEFCSNLNHILYLHRHHQRDA